MAIVEENSRQWAIQEEIGKLLSEWHSIGREEEDFDTKEEIICKTDYVISFEVSFLKDSVLLSIPHYITGDQTITTTLGLLARANIMVDDIFTDDNCDCGEH